MLRQKIESFESLGHSVHLFTFSTSEQEMFSLGSMSCEVTVEPLDYTGPSRFRRYIEASRRIAAKIDEWRADRVWVEKCRFVGAPSVLRFLKTPSILYLQEPIRIRAYEALAASTRAAKSSPGKKLSVVDWLKKISSVPEYYFRRREDRRSVEAAGKVFANSDFSAAWARRVYGIQAQTLYQGVDTDFFSPHPCGAENFALSVGRLDDTKGHDFIVAAIAGVPESLRPRLAVVCDAVDEACRRRLEAQAGKSGVSLQIYYRVSDEVLRDLYCRCLLVLCAAHHEPFGLVPLEAMACGAAVLAVREGGFVETIKDGRAGYLLERDVNVWSDKIQVLAANPSLRRLLGEHGRQEVLAEWGFKSFRQRLDQIVKSI